MGAKDDLSTLIDSIRGRTVAAKLRDLMPEIDRRLRVGVQQQEIVDALNAEGGFDDKLKLVTFRSCIYRYHKAQREGITRYERRKRGGAAPAGSEPREQESSLPQAGTRTGPVTATDLRKLRDEEMDLEALAALGKSTHTHRKGS